MTTTAGGASEGGGGPGDPYEHPRRIPHPILITIGVVLLLVLVIAAVAIGQHRAHETERQAQLDPFYTPPDPLPPGRPGDVVRVESMDLSVPGAPDGTQVWRVLYRSEYADGSPAVSSGMVFVPGGPAPVGGREIVAWAHPTIGMGTECAPSRGDDPLGDMSWLGQMLANRWVVTATDYVGLGTPGALRYLVGIDEARDVINSVRAARSVPGADAGTRFASWGHSQGGQSSLFVGMQAASYAPELQLVAVAAAAPAAELVSLVAQQWDNVVGWAIGPEVLVAWPAAYPELKADEVASRTGMATYRRLADQCILQAALKGAVLDVFGQTVFGVDPATVPDWRAAAEANTAQPLTPGLPVLVAQGLKDTVVLPNTTALYVQTSCAAGSDLATMWMGDTGHLAAAKVSGPAVTTWLQQRFAGVPATSTCDTSLPVAPATVPPL